MPPREILEPCPFCRRDVPETARRCPHCRAALPVLDDDPPPRRPRRRAVEDDDPPPRRLRRRAAEADDPPPRRLRRPSTDEFAEPRPRRRRLPPDDDDEPRPRRRRPRYDDEDDDYDDEPRPRRRRRGPYAPCPHCGCPGFADKVSFTWWGGLIGPALLSHVTCRKCGGGYNGKNGKDNTTAIIIYTVVGIGLGLLVFVGVLMANLAR